MENLVDSTSSPSPSSSSPSSSSSPNLNDNHLLLIQTLNRFSALQNKSSDLLSTTQTAISDVFTQDECMKVCEENQFLRFFFPVFGGVFGATFGGMSGGTFGTLGSVAATTFARFFGKTSMAKASFGLAGSVLAGAVGGASCGGLGAALGATLKIKGLAANGKFTHMHVRFDLFTGACGCAVGMAIGGIFGGKIGSAGGAVGAGVGAYYATKFWLAVVDSWCETRESKMRKLEEALRNNGLLRECFNLLVEEVAHVREICDKMEAGKSVEKEVQGLEKVTEQIQKEVSEIEEVLKQSQSAKHLDELVSGVKIADRKSCHVAREMETLKIKVEQLLKSLRKN